MTKLATLFAAAALLATAADQKTFHGVITDTMCGKNHAAMGVSPDSKCVIECVKHDKNTKYALFDGTNVYVLSDQKTPEQFAGQKVKITGTLYEKTKILKVDSMVADGNAGPAPASAHAGHNH